MEVIEVCPHCDHENTFKDVSDTMDTQMIGTCAACNKKIVLCDKCTSLNPDEAVRHCDNCPFCDLANFMNYLSGKNTIEQFFAALNPPLTDMTTGIPVGQEATLKHYINDDLGDGVNWDVKYWDLYRLVMECFLDKNSTEDDCRDFVAEIIQKNRDSAIVSFSK